MWLAPDISPVRHGVWHGEKYPPSAALPRLGAAPPASLTRPLGRQSASVVCSAQGRAIGRVGCACHVFPTIRRVRRLKGSRGLGPEIRTKYGSSKGEMELGDCPSFLQLLSEITKNETRGLGVPQVPGFESYSCSCFWEIRAESLYYSEEYQRLNPNLEDWGIMYDNEHELIKREMWKVPRADLLTRRPTLPDLAESPRSDSDCRDSPRRSRPLQTGAFRRARRHPV